MVGNVMVLFAPASDLIECMQLNTTSTEQVVALSKIERIMTNRSPTVSTKASPKVTKNKLPKAQQKMQSQYEALTIDHIPRAPTGDLGVTARVQQFLEVRATVPLLKV